MSRTRTQNADIPDVWPSKPVVPASRRYGAVDDLSPRPWSRVIDVLAGLGLVVAMVEEAIDFFGSHEWQHLAVAVVIGAALWIYTLRVGTRDLS